MWISPLPTHPRVQRLLAELTHHNMHYLSRMTQPHLDLLEASAATQTLWQEWGVSMTACAQDMRMLPIFPDIQALTHS